MKVIYVTSESYIDHSYTIAKELVKHVVLPVFIQSRHESPELASWAEHLGATVIKRKRFRNPWNLVREIGFILRLRKMNADMIWFNGLNIYQVLPVKFFIKKFLVTVHDVEKHPESRQRHAFLALKMTFALLKKHICVVSKTQAALFKNRFGFDAKMFQLPIIDYFTDAGSGSSRPVTKTGGPIKFFFFGSVEPYKGLETLLEAAEILQKKNLDFSLGIYGKLKYNRDELAQRIKALKNAELIDEFIDYKNISGIYKEGDVLVLPYKQVTQCGPILIGYNELVPAICSNQPGFLEYVDDAQSGLVFDNSAEDLAAKMEYVIKNPAVLNKMKEYINTVIKTKFAMPQLVEQYTENLK